MIKAKLRPWQFLSMMLWEAVCGIPFKTFTTDDLSGLTNSDLAELLQSVLSNLTCNAYSRTSPQSFLHSLPTITQPGLWPQFTHSQVRIRQWFDLYHSLEAGMELSEKWGFVLLCQHSLLHHGALHIIILDYHIFFKDLYSVQVFGGLHLC